MYTKKVYDEEDNIEGDNRFVYDISGNCIEEIYYDKNGQMEHHNKFIYDAHGNCTEEQYYNADEQLTSYLKLVYDKNGNCVYENHDGNCFYSIEFEAIKIPRKDWTFGLFEAKEKKNVL